MPISFFSLFSSVNGDIHVEVCAVCTFVHFQDNMGPSTETNLMYMYMPLFNTSGMCSIYEASTVRE